MADVSDPAIGEAYEQIRSNKDPKTWCAVANVHALGCPALTAGYRMLLEYVDGKKDTLRLAQTGEGNPIDEIKPLLKDDQVNFGYAKITYANDKESTREKFILIIFIGSKVGVMRRAKISVQKADVTKALRVYSIEVAIDSPDQLHEDSIVTRLRAAGGANYGPGV